VQFRIPPDVKEWLHHEAKAQDRSANSQVIKVLRNAMNAAKGDAPAIGPAEASVNPPNPMKS
jgi:hypothetical protein